jgi:hypothetical protein
MRFCVSTDSSLNVIAAFSPWGFRARGFRAWATIPAALENGYQGVSFSASFAINAER